eukprot:CAMPEP_0115889310 /NCGR_PEP_ID=MMETSP0287-20121206/32760_1 /TAXON_ID=412157 /ORGANISM="Chrysochromulina rotalis, Strain UIO044" /LENGTH=96 /DNA_ID=CAMNT_0003346027 /DNA_START=34 /DNA_END=324 /DNA_ORIENTATION=-
MPHANRYCQSFTAVLVAAISIIAVPDADTAADGAIAAAPTGHSRATGRLAAVHAAAAAAAATAVHAAAAAAAATAATEPGAVPASDTSTSLQGLRG